MKVRLKNRAAGRISGNAGEVIEVTEEDARSLLNAGAATEVDPLPEASEEKPKRKRATRKKATKKVAKKTGKKARKKGRRK